MADPIQVERNFQEVMSLLDSTPSIRHRYVLFKKFTESLEGSFKKYESYIIQLLEELPLYSDALSWSGLDPAETEEDLLLLESIQSSLELSDKNLYINSIKRNLQKVCLLLYACLNEKGKADEYLKYLTGRSFLNSRERDSTKTTRHDTLQTFYDFISEELQQENEFANNHYSSLQDIYQQLLELIYNSKEGSVLVPVAEVYKVDHPDRKVYGRLRKMTVELFGEIQSSTNDELIWATNIYGAETPSLRNNEDLVSASRRLYESTTSGRGNWKFYKGGIQFENRSANHDGNSANLGISTLWYVKLLEANSERERYQINPRAVITGDIDHDGTVEEVGENTIGLKVEAAFFSWANVMIVPFSQRSIAEKELISLQEKYPQKDLSIIGVNHLQEVFYDRRVASWVVEGRVKYFFKRLKKDYANLVLIPSIIVLLLIVARLAYGPIDHNPQSFSYEGSSLILENMNGAQVERLEVGTQTASLYPNAGAIGKYPLAVIHDLNNDGFNEVIYGKRNRTSDSREISDVTAYSVEGDSVLWEFPLMQNYEFPRQSAAEEQEMLIREMGLVHTNEGPKLVINANSHFYFQTIVYLLDAKTGALEAEYLHIGQLIDMMLQDISGDGTDEVILTGINNAYWMASLVVLDVNNFRGYSPLTRDYRPLEMTKAQEMYYLLFPKTLLGSYTDPVMKYNEGRRLNFDPLNNTIRVQLEEGRVVFREEIGRAALLVTLNQDLKPIGVGTSDIYDIVAKQLYEEGEIEEIPDFDYFQSYKDSIRYWNGTTFVLQEEYFKE